MSKRMRRLKEANPLLQLHILEIRIMEDAGLSLPVLCQTKRLFDTFRFFGSLKRFPGQGLTSAPSGLRARGVWRSTDKGSRHQPYDEFIGDGSHRERF